MQLKSIESIRTKKEDPQGQIKVSMGQLFDENKTSSARQDALLSRLNIFLKYFQVPALSQLNIDEMRNGLVVSAGIQKREEFVDRVVEILKPLTDLKTLYPKEFEEANSQSANEIFGYKELNRLVTYEKKDTTILLHHSIAHTIGPDRKLYEEAMRKLAQVAREDPKILSIEATSWIVAKVPALFTRNGFSVEKASKGFMNSINPTISVDPVNGKEVWHAFIDRQKFLERFGSKDDVE